MVPLLRAALGYGVHVLLSEPDVVWLRTPDMYLAVYDQLAADLLVASHCRYHFVARPNMERRTAALREPADSGVSLAVVGVKPTPAGLEFVDAWMHGVVSMTATGGQPDEGAALQVMTEAFAGALKSFDGDMLHKVPWLSEVPGGSWDAAAREDLFPRYPPRVNDGTQVMPYKACVVGDAPSHACVRRIDTFPLSSAQEERHPGCGHPARGLVWQSAHLVCCQPGDILQAAPIRYARGHPPGGVFTRQPGPCRGAAPPPGRPVALRPAEKGHRHGFAPGAAPGVAHP